MGRRRQLSSGYYGSSGLSSFFATANIFSERVGFQKSAQKALMRLSLLFASPGLAWLRVHRISQGSTLSGEGKKRKEERGRRVDDKCLFRSLFSFHFHPPSPTFFLFMWTFPRDFPTLQLLKYNSPHKRKGLSWGYRPNEIHGILQPFFLKAKIK